MAVFRIKKRTDFVRVAKSESRWVSASLVLQVAPHVTPAKGHEASPDFRAGFTASRKVGNAVKRNRAKRRLRAAVEQILPAKAQSGCDYVLIARSAAIGCPYDQLLKDLEFCLSGVHRNLRHPKAEALKK